MCVKTEKKQKSTICLRASAAKIDFLKIHASGIAFFLETIQRKKLESEIMGGGGVWLKKIEVLHV